MSRGLRQQAYDARYAALPCSFVTVTFALGDDCMVVK